MTLHKRKYFKSRLLLLNAFIAFVAFSGILSSCGSKKKLHHHVLYVNDMYLGQDSTSTNDGDAPDYNSPNQDATRYGVRPTN